MSEIVNDPPAAPAPRMDAPPVTPAYNGPLAFCLVEGAPGFDGLVPGPQGKRYLVVGALPDGRRLGVAGVYPQEMAILKAAHPDEYVADSWNALLVSPYAAAVAWEVRTANRGWVPEAALEPEDRVERTSRGHRLRRPPIADGAAGFDPDHVPAVGTTRVVAVPGGEDRVQIVRTGADGVRDWYEVPTGRAA
jgi:hypothetical protein